MVEKFRKLFNQSTAGLHEAAIVLGLSAVASQLLALARDRIFAHIFGAGAQLDVYYAAFKIPDLLFATVASMVSLSVLIPYFTRELAKGVEPAREFLDSVFTTFLFILLSLSVIVFFLMPKLSLLVAPGFDYTARLELITLSRILLLSPIFLGLSGHLASIVQSFRKFFVYALCPIVYNAGIIFGALVLYPKFGSRGLAFGVVLGALLHLYVQWPVVSRLGFSPRLRKDILWPRVREVFLVSIPRTLTLGAHQLVFLIFTSIASFFAVGSISVLNFAYNLQSVPLAIIGVSYSMAAFPTLSALYASGEKVKFFESISLAARHIIFWSMPVTALFIVLRAQIVRTILGTGAFDWTSTRLVAAALALFVISTVAQGLVFLFIRGHYARGDTRKPFWISLGSSVTMITFATLLYYTFTHSDFLRYFIEALLRVDDVAGGEVLMLPLAYTIGVSLSALVYFGLFMRASWYEGARIVRTASHAFYVSVVMGFVAYLSLSFFDNIFDLETLAGIFMQGFLSGVVAIIAGVIILKVLNNSEYLDLERAFSRRFWDSRPVLPGPEDITTI